MKPVFISDEAHRLLKDDSTKRKNREAEVKNMSDILSRLIINQFGFEVRK